MALVLTEEQQMLSDAATGFLAEKAPVSALRKLRDERDENGYSKELWQQMVDMGWAGIAIPENYGGSDYGYVGLGIVLQAVGKYLSVSPINASVLVGATLVQLTGSETQKNALLSAVANGELLLSLALEEGAHHAPEQTALSAAPQGNNFVLNGDKVFVLDAHVADKFIVAARSAGVAGDSNGISLFLVDRNVVGLTVERTIMVDSRNAGTVKFDNVAVSADRLLGEKDHGYGSLQQTLDIANIGLSAELLGLSLQAFEQTVQYLKEREQFGAVIGTFQGLQHRAAHLFCELELCKSMVLNALQAVDAKRDGLSFLASATKAKMCEVATLATNEAVQMHGGVGMTDEFDIGFYIKRARVAQQTFGDYNYHLDRYAGLNGY
ncbi:MAG: acyl-CoA dehydrogenase family protein [Pseudomonadales bacterium]